MREGRETPLVGWIIKFFRIFVQGGLSLLSVVHLLTDRLVTWWDEQYEGTLVGTALSAAFGYWFGGAAILYLVGKLCGAELKAVESLALVVRRCVLCRVAIRWRTEVVVLGWRRDVDHRCAVSPGSWASDGPSAQPCCSRAFDMIVTGSQGYGLVGYCVTLLVSMLWDGAFWWMLLVVGGLSSARIVRPSALG